MSDGVPNQNFGETELEVAAARELDTITITLELPVAASLSSYVRILERARDAQIDASAKQALAVLAALASRGLVVTLAKSIK
jgi:hypothetical protein